jgi:hypothetical protein
VPIKDKYLLTIREAGAFSKSIDIGIQTSYARLNSTSSVSIFQMTLTSLPAQCPRAAPETPGQHKKSAGFLTVTAALWFSDESVQAV